MADQELVSVRLICDEWSVVQEALDEYYYEVEHSEPGGFRKGTNSARPRRGPVFVTVDEGRLTAAFSDSSGSCSRTSSTSRCARSRSSFRYFLRAGTTSLSRGFEPFTRPVTTHTVVDDYSRVAYDEIHDDEAAATAAGVLRPCPAGCTSTTITATTEQSAKSRPSTG
jgi:hypothetical protein